MLADEASTTLEVDMHASRSKRNGSWAQPVATYRRRALTHYTQGAVVLTPIAIGTLTMSLVAAALTLVLAEILILVVLPSLAVFRRHVDRQVYRIACARAADSRAVLVSRMGDRQRRELEKLERLAFGACRSRAVESTTPDWPGIDGILAEYVRLAIALRENESSFQATYYLELEREIAELEVASVQTANATASSEPDLENATAWIARRRGVLEQRRETWQRARDERALLTAKLATLADVVRWVSEQAALGRTLAVHGNIDEVIGACVHTAPLLREIAALDVEPAQPEVLRLGWQAPKDLAVSSHLAPPLPSTPEPPFGALPRAFETAPAEVRAEVDRHEAHAAVRACVTRA